MVDTVKGIKGMPDILPADTAGWQFIEQAIRQLMMQYQYQEIRNPILENTKLFKRSIGEVTDIVEKEMYTFDDRNGDSLTLRPEGTAGCVRACVEHSLVRNQQQQRLWYLGPMYRYERPQRGRYRQFHQLGVEAFNFASPSIEAEQIAIAARLWQELDIGDIVELEINSLGNLESRAKYKEKLVAYFTDKNSQLDDDSKRRLDSNPLRILDSKNPDMIDLISKAPVLIDHIDKESKQHFDYLQQQLQDLGIKYKINNHIVRGLDYYNRTVYEWTSNKLGAQSAVCSGGRFDTLVENLGGPPTPAAGFAIGLERLLLLLIEQNKINLNNKNKAYLICVGENAQSKSCYIAEKIRSALPNMAILTYLGSGSIGKVMQKADKAGASYAFIVGDDELTTQTVTVKFLRNSQEQKTVEISALKSVIDSA